MARGLAPINKKAVMLMTKLALHNKNFGKIDEQADAYYRWDFIYKRNSSTRWSVFVGLIIVLFFRYLYILAVKNVDIFHMNFKQEFIFSAIFVVAVLLLYTLIGSVQGYRLYTQSQVRIDEYNERLLQLAAERKNL